MPARLLAALPALALVATLAAAQAPGVPPGGGSTQRPVVSPYLNLLRNGNPGLNYLGLVRPEQQFRANQSQLQTQLNATNQNLTQFQTTVGQFTGLGGDLTTGTVAGFQTQRSYFLTTGTGAGGGFGTTGGLRGGAGGVGSGVPAGRGGLGGARPAVGGRR